MNVLESSVPGSSVPGTIFVWVFRALRIQENTEQDLQTLLSRLILGAGCLIKASGEILAPLCVFAHWNYSVCLFSSSY